MIDEDHSGLGMGIANVLDYAQISLTCLMIKSIKTLNQISYMALAVVAEIIVYKFYGKMPLGAPSDFKHVEGP